MDKQRERDLPREARALAHQRLDELLDLYEQGAPLWIVGSVGWVSPDDSARLDLTVRDSYA